jgi:hypothetical protein
MTEEEQRARQQTGAEVVALEALRNRLLTIRASLPETPVESVSLEDLNEMDITTEIRSVIGCVLQDCIEPAIRDLQDLVDLPEAPEASR